jgi:type III pantothenate kinase
MIALFDVGNTHTHIGLAGARRVARRIHIATAGWQTGHAQKQAAEFLQNQRVTAVVLCSVVPAATPILSRFAAEKLQLPCLELTAQTVRGIGIEYPKPETIGPDRLANAVAVKLLFGAPAVVVDFGTAVTFDVVNARGNYAGGIIAPGLNVMTDYLHEKTALLPRIKIREVQAIIGKNTEEAMLIGAVHGYRGLIRELVAQLKRALKCPRLPVVATGGYARLISSKLPDITAVAPLLTLEGLRLVWQAHQCESQGKEPPGGQKPCQLTDADVLGEGRPD